MYRKPTPHTAELEQLNEQRNDLKIQIHVAAENNRIGPASLEELLEDLQHLERKIDAYWRRLNRA